MSTTEGNNLNNAVGNDIVLQIREIKKDLKQRADDIRFLKLIRKERFKDRRPDGLKTQYSIQWELEKKRHDVRHRHIAYCLLRGTPLEKIEQPAEDNLPDMSLVETLKLKFEDGKL